MVGVGSTDGKIIIMNRKQKLDITFLHPIQKFIKCVYTKQLKQYYVIEIFVNVALNIFSVDEFVAIQTGRGRKYSISL